MKTNIYSPDWEEVAGYAFDRFLYQWRTNLANFDRYFETDDALFAYNETAVVGTLSAAVWQVGGLAVQDYITYNVKPGAIKKRKVENENSAEYRKPDLWFELSGKRYVAEAKKIQLDIPLGANKVDAHSAAITAKINEAKNQVLELTAGEGFDHRLVLVLVVPKFQQNVAETEVGRYFDLFIEEQRQVANFAFASPYLRLDESGQQGLGWSGKHWPGALLLGFSY
ncbi:MAG: hypothetical protein RRB13_09320 [bacterium]|nr:hypothetical protein [bacterium]